MMRGYNAEIHTPRKVRRRHLNPKIKEGAEWALAGLITVLGTVVAIEVLAAMAAIMM